jgi:hypothetical protein
MRRLYTFLCFLLSGIGVSAQHIEDNPRLLDSLLSSHRDMHFYRSPTLGCADRVWHRTEHIYLYFDTDSICRQFIRGGGYGAVTDGMEYLYYSVFTEMPPERRAAEIMKMEKTAREYGSEALLREAELQSVLNMPDGEGEETDCRIRHLRELQYKAAGRGDTLMLLQIRKNILHELRYRYSTFEALEEALEIIEFLDRITGRQYIE